MFGCRLPRKSILSLLATSLVLAGCSTVVPNFDIPIDQSGAPTIRSITNRITCELAGLVDDSHYLSSTLLADDTQVALQLNLTVNDEGGLSPTTTYISGPFSFGVSATAQQSREQNFTAKLFYSLREVREQARSLATQNEMLTDCKAPDTNLAGELGLKKAAELAFTTPHLKWDAKLTEEGVFGGYVSFIVTKNVNAGPTWVLKSFVGPGNLASLSEINTDKLTFAFARGDKRGTAYRRSSREKAERLIDQININQLTTQLGGVRQVIR